MPGGILQGRVMSIYHYTTIEGVKGILDSQALHLTHVRYMNDSEEITHAFNHYKQRVMEHEIDNLIKSLNLKAEEDSSRLLKSDEIHKVKDTISKTLDLALGNAYIFAASFCQTKNNLLSQWRGYSNGTIGYCIEFNEDKLIEASYKITGSKDIFMVYDNCIYDEKETLSLLNEQVPEIAAWNEEYSSLPTVFRICSLSKNGDFSEENEKRLVAVTHNNSTKIKFKTKNGILCPYIELQIPKDAIKAINIGPCSEPDLIKFSMKEFLRLNGYKGVTVTTSKTPLRQHYNR